MEQKNISNPPEPCRSAFEESLAEHPNRCVLDGICMGTVTMKELWQECLDGKPKCDKGQRVMIELLNDILAELREINARLGTG